MIIKTLLIAISLVSVLLLSAQVGEPPSSFKVVVVSPEKGEPEPIEVALGGNGSAADFSEPTVLLFIHTPDENAPRLAKLLNLVVKDNKSKKALGAVIYVGEPDSNFIESLPHEKDRIPVTKYVNEENNRAVPHGYGDLTAAEFPATVVIWKGKEIRKIFPLTSDDLKKGSKEKAILVEYIGLLD